MKTSGNTTSLASSDEACPTQSHIFVMVPSLSRKIGEVCAAAIFTGFSIVSF
jgi:hypothetical protein